MRKSLVSFLFVVLAGCSFDEAHQVKVRRIEVDGDNARYVGSRLVHDLRLRGVRVSESAESAPVLKATSTIKKLENGVRVFTLEITDGKGLSIKETVSNQDLDPLAGPQYIIKAIDQAADSVARQLLPKETIPTPASPPDEAKKKHFSTS